MSDFGEWLGKESKSPNIKKIEKEEQSEGVAKALKSGKGDIVKGAKKRGLDPKKDGLKAQLAKAKVPPKSKGMKKKVSAKGPRSTDRV